MKGMSLTLLNDATQLLACGGAQELRLTVPTVSSRAPSQSARSSCRNPWPSSNPAKFLHQINSIVIENVHAKVISSCYRLDWGTREVLTLDSSIKPSDYMSTDGSSSTLYRHVAGAVCLAGKQFMPLCRRYRPCSLASLQIHAEDERACRPRLRQRAQSDLFWRVHASLTSINCFHATLTQLIYGFRAVLIGAFSDACRSL